MEKILLCLLHLKCKNYCQLKQLTLAGIVISRDMKTNCMKPSRSTDNAQNKQGLSHKPRPEIRDNLDSRKNEEQQFKGDDVTHNEKYVQNDRTKHKK
jgi:hypothetical protein